MELDWHGFSETGRKPTNQDRFGVFTTEDTYVLAVCDGLGGHAGGEVAADMALEALRNFELPSKHVKRALHRLAVKVSEAIAQRGEDEPELQYMGSTLTAVVLSDVGCWFVHVGDSRLYRLRKGELEQLTSDHRFVQEFIDAGDMSETEARGHPLRSQLDQALGVPDMEPDIDSIEVRPGDVLLVCSDGITDELPAGKIVEILSIPNGVKSKAQTLVQAALAAGGHDNATAVVALVEA